MAQRQWTFDLPDGSHTVELDHSAVSGKRSIHVDGREVPLGDDSKGSLIDLGGQVPVPVGSTTGVVHIRTNGLRFSYDLSIDGRSVETGQPVSESGSEESQSVPAWGWVAVALCVALPIATLGGAIPTGLGGGGAFGCYLIARDRTKPAATRMALCAAVVVGCWAIVVALLVAVL